MPGITKTPGLVKSYLYCFCSSEHQDDKTALFHAAEKNKPEVIDAILESPEGKELLSVNDQYDNLPIHVASKMGNVDCVRRLHDAGADIDNKNEDEQTPLHLAAMNGRIRVVEYILRYRN